MKILAIDSSGIVASVAVVTDNELVSEYTINYKKTHSQTLMPMIEEMNKSIELDLKTIDSIAVAAGPGSFTGLRIGAATAKGLALALNKSIISVPTLDGLAYNIYNKESLICPIMDARRDQVYTSIYKIKENKLIKLTDYMATDIKEILTKLKEYNKSVIFNGDGVSSFKEIIIRSELKEYSFAPVHLMKQHASSVGALAIEYAKQGKIVSANEFVPFYLRKSQAEREHELKKKAE
ncbi:MAG: tRNA (adenosine(37)-N6)-threonylcarbamoyltransferase complex dimerization subunit type 1 TsaB [Eubacteriales bacterium]